MPTYIASLQNPKLKYLLHLQEKSRTRKKEGVFVVEGKREIELLLLGHYTIKELYFCADFHQENEPKSLLNACATIIELSKEAYQKVAYRGSTEGIIAIVEAKEHRLKDLQFHHPNPLVLVAEAPEKPGNIGAILRTADAAGVDAVLIANPKTDLYNPNIIRSSVGTVFTQPIAMENSKAIIEFLKNQGFKIYSAILQEAVSYLLPDYTSKCAIVVGTEAEGLTTEWRDASTKNIIIPMNGKIDSMNVSVATGILLFEAVRQRKEE